MTEGQPQDKKERAAELIREIVAIALELNESRETFPFPGLNPTILAKIRGDEEHIPNYSSYATPIDELRKRFEKEGIRVVLGEHPDSGNVFILPAQSHDIERDSLHTNHLEPNDMMDSRLQKIILAAKEFTSLSK